MPDIKAEITSVNDVHCFCSSLRASPEGVTSSVKDNSKVCWWRLKLQQVKHSSYEGKQDAGVFPCLSVQANILPPKV